MRSRVIWRRSATAIGTYVAAGLGFLTTVVATRELGLHDYAKFAAVFAASVFFQQLLDLTIEEALVKFGFRYTESQRWGRLRRLFEVALGFKLVGGVLAALAICALAPFAKQVWGTGGVVVPMLIASPIAIAQAPENVAAGAIILRGRYDVRGGFLAVSMGLRLIGLAIGCRYGVAGAVLGMVVAQVLATAAIGIAGLAAFRRFPQAPSEPLGEDVRAVRGFLVSSTLASSLDSARGDARHLARADRRPDRPGRLLPQRPGARDRLRGALGPGAARDADRADPRLRGRPPRPRLRHAPALRRRHAVPDARRRPDPLDR